MARDARTSHVFVGLWYVGMPSHPANPSRGAAKSQPAPGPGSVAERLNALVADHPSATAHLLSAYGAHVSGLLGAGRPRPRVRSERDSRGRRAWLHRRLSSEEDRALCLAEIHPDEVTLAVQELVAETIMAVPTLAQLVCATHAHKSVKAVRAAVMAAAAGRVARPCVGLPPLAQAPARIIEHVHEKLRPEQDALTDEQLDVLREVVPWAGAALPALLKHAPAAAAGLALVPPLLRDDYLAVAALFTAVLGAAGVRASVIRVFRKAVAALYGATAQPGRAGKLLADFAVGFPETAALVGEAALGFLALNSTRNITLDGSTAEAQQQALARVHDGLPQLSGRYLFCGCCDTSVTPEKPRLVGRAAQRSLRHHDAFDELAPDAADVPLTAAQLKTATGYSKAMMLLAGEPGSDILGHLVCKRPGRLDCNSTPLLGADLRGRAFVRHQEVRMLCVLCGGVFVAHDDSAWNGPARICDPCNVKPRPSACRGCDAQFFPRLDSSGLSVICHRCATRCMRCKVLLPEDPSAGAYGRTRTCDTCARTCTRCDKTGGFPLGAGQVCLACEVKLRRAAEARVERDRKQPPINTTGGTVSSERQQFIFRRGAAGSALRAGSELFRVVLGKPGDPDS